MPMSQQLTLDEDGFAFDPSTGDSYLVNPSGLAILKSLREGKLMQEIAQALATAYRITVEDARRDVSDFLSHLKSFGLG